MAEWVKVTALVSEDVRRRARMKALSEGVSLSSVLREFLERWVSEAKKSPEKQFKKLQEQRRQGCGQT